MTLTTNTRAPTHQRQQLLHFYALCVVVLGFVLAGRGTWDVFAALEFADHGVTTDARLAGITSMPAGKGRVTHHARVRYLTADGQQISATTEDSIAPAEHKVGEKLQVTYLPTDPGRVRLAAGADPIGFWPRLLVGLGIALGLAGLAWRLLMRRQLAVAAQRQSSTA